MCIQRTCWSWLVQVMVDQRQEMIVLGAPCVFTRRSEWPKTSGMTPRPACRSEVCLWRCMLPTADLVCGQSTVKGRTSVQAVCTLALQSGLVWLTPPVKPCRPPTNEVHVTPFGLCSWSAHCNICTTSEWYLHNHTCLHAFGVFGLIVSALLQNGVAATYRIY